MLSSCIYYIIGYCQSHHTLRIWMTKIDWQSTYYRQHLHSQIAKHFITQIIIDDISIISLALCLTFGKKPCPSGWGCISETAADIVNDILQCEYWNSTIAHPLTPTQQNLIPEPTTLPDDIPFQQALSIFVDIPTDENGKCDVYIGDMNIISPDTLRLFSAVPLVIHTLCPCAVRWKNRAHDQRKPSRAEQTTSRKRTIQNQNDIRLGY